MRYGFWFIAFCLLSATRLGAQSADTLWEAWLEQQRQAWQGWEELVVEEEGHRLIDAPYGLHRIRFVAEMRVSPKHLERKIQLLEIDNRAVQTAAFRRVIPPEPLWLSPLLDQWPPFRLLATFQPQGSSVADSTDQVACWRIELLPLNRPPIERATLWFARDDGRLVQSRLLVRGPRTPAPTVIQTHFVRMGGRDLPVHRQLTWLHPIRRRMHRYTLLITQDLFYRNYHVKTSGIP